MKPIFSLHAPYAPNGDQPTAIASLLAGLRKNSREQTLLGVTGSGKTFTMANIIAAMNRPTLIISHNKTLAAQLASEFQDFFPKNAVNYFVSYYDYYQPEAYVPQKDLYIEKESQINEEIDRLRNAATHDLLTRRDVIIVASVSCIYGVGNPARYKEASFTLSQNDTTPRRDILKKLQGALYDRNDFDFKRGTYRVRGETIDVHPAYSEEGIRLQFDGDRLETIAHFDTITGHLGTKVSTITIFPGRQFVTPTDAIPKIASAIRDELAERITWFKKNNKPLEAERIEQRTNFDLEMLLATGFTTGVENYSRYFDLRPAGSSPTTLLDYFPKDFLLFIDESHMTVPQIRAMYEGDRSRKQTLIEYGFRLPSALDNRPLKFEEFESRVGQRIYVSATPAEFEIQRSAHVAEQLIRPTGLLDPSIDIRPTKHQIDDVLVEIKKTVADGQRVLITTLTKRMSEDLSEYLDELHIKVQYLHSDIETMERLEILRNLRLGKVDVVVGINLLREGLDLPEVSLVIILDADKEGFLRSETALMQVMGRAARHLSGRVIMYADTVTGSMQRAIDETKRRRKIQAEYNTKNHITPASVVRKIQESRLSGKEKEVEPVIPVSDIPPEELPRIIQELRAKMELAADNLDFESAAQIRDTLATLENRPLPARASRFQAKGRGKRSSQPSRFGKRR